MTHRLAGKTAFITAAGQGIGRATAEAFVREGARVIATDINEELLADLARATGCETRRLDVTDASAVLAATLEAGRKSTVDVLFNGAGYVHAGTILECDEVGFDFSFDLNVRAMYRLIRALLPPMLAAGKGSIINVASVSAHIPLSRVVAYSAAKAAVLSLTQFLAREWAKSGVRVNSLTPGFFPAEQNRKLLFKDDGSPTERAQQILGHTPMARFGKDEELIGAAVFLASSLASGFVTGSDIRVDGGFLAQTI